MIDFPTPTGIGQVYTYLARSWVWNGSGWERLFNSGQVVSVFFTRTNVSPLIPFVSKSAFNTRTYI